MKCVRLCTKMAQENIQVKSITGRQLSHFQKWKSTTVLVNTSGWWLNLQQSWKGKVYRWSETRISPILLILWNHRAKRSARIQEQTAWKGKTTGGDSVGGGEMKEMLQRACNYQRYFFIHYLPSKHCKQLWFSYHSITQRWIYMAQSKELELKWLINYLIKAGYSIFAQSEEFGVVAPAQIYFHGKTSPSYHWD